MKTFTAEERKKFILDYVKENEFVDITYLKDTLLVSEMTIRRDLKEAREAYREARMKIRWTSG